MLHLLNSAVMPTEGVYTLKRISETEFQTTLQAADDFRSDTISKQCCRITACYEGRWHTGTQTNSLCYIRGNQ